MLIFSNIGLQSKANYSIIDSIKQEKVVTTWTNEGDYFISDYKAELDGIKREYEGVIFYKFEYGGIFIDKKNGDVFQKMWLSLEGEKYLGDYPSEMFTGNWDLSTNDTNIIIVGEYNAEQKEVCRIISYNGNNADTLYKWINDIENYYRNYHGHYYFNVINENEFLVQFDVRESYQGLDLNKKESLYINSGNSNETRLNRMNLAHLAINESKDRFITTVNSQNTDYEPEKSLQQYSYDFFEIADGICSQTTSLGLGRSRTYSDFINDSLCTYIQNDSLYLYNLSTKTNVAPYYLGYSQSTPGIYYDKVANVANIVYSTQKGKKLFAIHLPTLEVVIDKYVNAPYLGKPISMLGDGFQLSIGDSGYLYKHNNDLLKYDSISVDFNFENSIESIVKFNELTFGAIVKWNWSFGDGNESTEGSPTHQYNKGGEYTVVLSVIDAFGNERSITKTIKVEDRLKSSFEFAKYSGNAPLSIEFHNYSTANARRFIWNFGDGTYSYEKDAVHIYTTPGTYSVSLTALDENENFHTYLSPQKVIVSE